MSIIDRVTPREKTIAEEVVALRAQLPFLLPDFDLELAQRAHNGTSFDPELRGLQAERDYVSSVVSLYREVLPLAETLDQQHVLRDTLIKYAAKFLQMQGAMLAAQSRTFSTFISGGSNYPARQQAKRFATVDKRREEFLDWDKKARPAVKKAVLAARTPEQVEIAGWAAEKRHIDRNMAMVHGIDTETEPQYYTRSAFVTTVTGRLARLSNNGEHALVVKALDYIAAQQAGWKKPYLTKQNGAWKLREAAAAALAAPPAPEVAEESGENDVIEERDGITILRNREIDRVQIIFPGKPSEDQRTKLRGAGWNWSPTNQAWQRKLTNAAEYSAKYVLGWS